VREFFPSYMIGDKTRRSGPNAATSQFKSLIDPSILPASVQPMLDGIKKGWILSRSAIRSFALAVIPFYDLLSIAKPTDIHDEVRLAARL
jgi:hypothetical protein